MVLMFQAKSPTASSPRRAAKHMGAYPLPPSGVRGETGLYIAAFTPPPKVDSTVVESSRPAPVAEADSDALEKVVAAAFSQRRKMLRAGLKGLFADPSATLEAVGIPLPHVPKPSISPDFARLRAHARKWLTATTP